MRYPGVPTAVAAFAIPPHPPEAVAKVKRDFDGVAGRWAAVKGELQDAEEALKEAKAFDLRALVNAAEQGREVKDPQAKTRKAEAEIADLKARLRGLNVAVDEAGNRLAQAIARHRHEWLPRLAEAEVEAAARFDEAVAAAVAALDQLRPARGAVAWLTAFNVEQAQRGEAAQFAGGHLEVKSTGLLRGTFEPGLLLATATKVTRKEEVTTRARAGTPVH
jgi:hypothetical protein